MGNLLIIDVWLAGWDSLVENTWVFDLPAVNDYHVLGVKKKGIVGLVAVDVMIE